MGVSHVDDDSDTTVTKEGSINTDEKIGYDVSFISTDPDTPADVSEPIPVPDEEKTAIEVAEGLLASVDGIADAKVKKALNISFKLLIVELKALKEVREKLIVNPTPFLKLKEKILVATIKLHLKGLTELIQSYKNKGKITPEVASLFLSGLTEIGQKI